MHAREEDSAEVNGEETGNREGETGENQGQGEGMDFQMDEETHVDPLRTEECEPEWTDEEQKTQKTLKRLKKIMDESNRKRIPALKNVNKRKILSEVKKVELVLEKLNTDNITETNDLIYAAAVVVSENLAVKRGGNKNEKKPWWKRRLGSQIQQLRKDN